MIITFVNLFTAQNGQYKSKLIIPLMLGKRYYAPATLLIYFPQKISYSMYVYNERAG